MRKYFIIIILNIFLSIFFINDTYCRWPWGFESSWYIFPPPSAKISGMGCSSVAMIDGANTIFWNPGGISFLEGINNSYIPLEYPSVYVYGSARIRNFSISNNFKKKFTIGLNYRDRNDIPDGSDRKREFSDLGISLGLKIKNIGIGINLKHFKSYDIFDNFGHYGNGYGMAVDIGILYSNTYSKLRRCEIDYNFGISLLNVSKGIKYENSNITSDIPNIVKEGYSVSFNPLLKYKEKNVFCVTHSFEYSFVTNEYWMDPWDNRQYSFGFEVSFFNILSLRSGYYYIKGQKEMHLFEETFWYNKKPVSEYTYGFGVNLPVNYFIKKIPLIVKYDYAMLPSLKKDFFEPNEFNISTFSIQYLF